MWHELDRFKEIIWYPSLGSMVPERGIGAFHRIPDVDDHSKVWVELRKPL